MGFWAAAAPYIVGAVGGIAGSLINSNSQQRAGELNAQQQLEFAQKGIRWRVDDAKKAGIHPLYALGANTTQASPSYAGGDPGTPIANAAQGAMSGMLQDQMMEGSMLDNEIKLETLRGIAQDNHKKQNENLMSDLRMQGEAQGHPDMYVMTYDQYTKKLVPVPNPDYFQDMQGLVPTWLMQRMIRSEQKRLGGDFFTDSYNSIVK